MLCRDAAGDDAGKEGKLLFTGKEVFPLSPRPSLLFKKSGETFLFTFTYPCWEHSLLKKRLRRVILYKKQ